MEKRANQLRNIAYVGHGGSGKTTLAEAVLFNGKATTRLCKVDDGSSNLDFEPEEIKRKITISSSFHHCNWKKHVINIIDTPGDDNFLSDTKSSLQAADAVIVVIDATSGIKIGTEKVWEFANDQNLSKIVFVNKMDRENADFSKIVDEVEDNFSVKVTPVNIPIGAEDKFEGVIDLVRMKASLCSKDGSGKSDLSDIPADLMDTAEEWREKMLENVAEVDDELMEKYLEGEELTTQEIEKALYQGIKTGQLTVVTCGSSSLNMGVTHLMDLVIQGVRSPLERESAKGTTPGKEDVEEREPSFDAPFSALVFKTLADPFAGKLTIIRVLSGTVQSDTYIYNANKDVKEKIGNLLLLEGKKQQPTESAGPGDIVAFAKLRETATGDTLCAPDHPIIYTPVKPSPPVISYAISAKVKGSEDKIFSSLTRLLEEDPTLRLERDATTADTILSGTGQIHIETTCEKLHRKFGVEVNLDSVKVPYRETIKKAVKGIVYRHKKQSGGRGQFAEVHFDLSPLPKDSGFEFVEDLTGMNVPRNFVPAVEKGLNESLHSGPVAGYPIVDLTVRFYDGKSHEVDSSEMAFKIAASMCLKKGIQEANPVLLEPVMKMEIIVPEESMGDVMGDLNGRRGKVLGMEAQGRYQVIKAQAPMSEVLRYALDLNSISGGRGTFHMEKSHYEELPAQLAAKIIAASQVEKE